MDGRMDKVEEHQGPLRLMMGCGYLHGASLKLVASSTLWVCVLSPRDLKYHFDFNMLLK